MDDDRDFLTYVALWQATDILRNARIAVANDAPGAWDILNHAHRYIEAQAKVAFNEAFREPRS